jgi:7-cyano-7-deazaguanine synthase
VAVLVSGGPDSAILVGELAATSPRVVPVYVRLGLVWRFLRALAAPTVAPLLTFDMPARPVYGPHWSLTGEGVPDADSPDRAVFLPGRNLIIALQAAIWCHLNDVPTIALGLLKGNPFPDSTDDFFQGYESALNQALGGRLRLVRPYAGLSKIEVLWRGRSFPLGETWSCMRPVGDRHCGRCNKCAERQRAFARAELPDPTDYAS